VSIYLHPWKTTPGPMPALGARILVGSTTPRLSSDIVCRRLKTPRISNLLSIAFAVRTLRVDDSCGGLLLQRRSMPLKG